MKEYVLSIGGKEYRAEVKSISSESASIVVNGKEYEVELEDFGISQAAAPVARPAADRPAQPAAPVAHAAGAASRPSPSGLAGSITSPLPGLILEVLVREGDEVKAGQDLMVMEAMKMENKIQSPHDGVVRKIFVQQGANVAEGEKLIEVTRPMMTTL